MAIISYKMEYFNQNIIGIHQTLMVLLCWVTTIQFRFYRFIIEKCLKECFFMAWLASNVYFCSVRFMISHDMTLIVVGQRSVFGFVSHVQDWIDGNDREYSFSVLACSKSTFGLNIVGSVHFGSFIIISIEGLGTTKIVLYSNIAYTIQYMWNEIVWRQRIQSKWFRNEKIERNQVDLIQSENNVYRCVCIVWLLKRKEIHLTTGIE